MLLAIISQKLTKLNFPPEEKVEKVKFGVEALFNQKFNPEISKQIVYLNKFRFQQELKLGKAKLWLQLCHLPASVIAFLCRIVSYHLGTTKKGGRVIKARPLMNFF